MSSSSWIAQQFVWLLTSGWRTSAFGADGEEGSPSRIGWDCDGAKGIHWLNSLANPVGTIVEDEAVVFSASITISFKTGWSIGLCRGFCRASGGSSKLGKVSPSYLGKLAEGTKSFALRSWRFNHDTTSTSFLATRIRPNCLDFVDVTIGVQTWKWRTRMKRFGEKVAIVHWSIWMKTECQIHHEWLFMFN